MKQLNTLLTPFRNPYLQITLIVLLINLVFFVDPSLLRKGTMLRFSWLDGVLLYLTDFGLLFFSILLSVSVILKKHWKLLFLIFLALILRFEISYLLKLFFQTPRPYLNLDLAQIPLTQAAGFSFPSLHSAYCFGLIPFINKIYTSKTQRFLAISIAIIIAFSRAYLGVHFFSDILAGGLIGYAFSKLALYVEARYQFTDWFVGNIKSKLELRRQIAHLVTGIAVVFLIHLKLLTPNLLVFLLIIGAGLSLLQKYRPSAFIHEILIKFEREEDLRNFPGKGAIFLMLGSLLALLIFPINIAKGAIMVLAVGDSISHLVGRYFGKIKFPLSQNKMMEGTVFAIVFSTLGALLYVDFTKAFIASLIAVVAETIYPAKLAKYFDDNLLVPLLAGGIMLFLS
ncbi:phosphatase PAP2 family protein [Candidatus Peregrinibacteria bacterium]|nr:phosphatase PAP2 family protein [Candidatus Peregrinibacteria bacterium]